ncbi:metal ABC transporter ATP-binding protein [Fusibacter sp. 3D3]|uniref:metal ABC transporter ATP-binding protein n=1 Tax=Fusibacter sp. 3D3 TaxID=1048380 RepID=UPI00085292F2|nr:metal ABC transporter ATP-binding protein [Fusibacter sp. 3D3]GAU76678.1 zinc ABC transporter, ATP-binding protein ZnuC [Fusibacter sp. 3D3]
MIEIQNLYFSYSNQSTYVLNDINITVNRGDYISVLGENGSGKSTLMKLILKLMTPSKGTLKNDFLRIGYVPQLFDNLNTQFPITVYELLECYRKTLKIKDKNCVAQSLEIVNMSAFKNALVGTLSGGQRQKVFIARAMIGHPDLLVLDEPSSGIDVNSQDEIYGLIKNININQKVTVISVEHNLKAAMDNSSHIYHLKNGSGHLCKPEDYIHDYVKSSTGGRVNVSI